MYIIAYVCVRAWIVYFRALHIAHDVHKSETDKVCKRDGHTFTWRNVNGWGDKG